MAETVATILVDEITRIGRNVPFGEMGDETLAMILALASVQFCRHGSIVAHPHTSGSRRRLWLVRQGSVRAGSLPGSCPEVDALAEESLGVGALLPLECALSSTPPARIYTAAEDSFLWKIDGPALDLLLEQAAFLRWLALYWQASGQEAMATVAGLASSRQMADQALALPARSAGTTTLVHVAPAATIGEIATLMTEKKIGSVIVGNVEAVAGIVTRTDLVSRGMAAALPADAPVTQVMTAAPTMIEESATVLEAGLEMTRLGFRHLLIGDTEGRLTGIVSERDLFRVQQQGNLDIFRPISEARTVDELVVIAANARALTERAFRQGMEVSQLTRLVSSISDSLSRRVIALIMEPAHPDAGYCWLAFGSEGREEQGFVTDQDNGIVFAEPAGTDVEKLRTRYARAAAQVNQALGACGFDLCKGNIMAGNPEWCLSLDEWKRRFSSWIAATTPTAVLHSTIFFDFRPIFGDAALADALREHLLDAVAGQSLFLNTLATSALEAAPPVGRLSRFITGTGEHKGTIDLKTQGTRLFVDIARIYALAAGVRTANTEQRLRLSGQCLRRNASAVEGDVAAFRFVQKLRLQRQLDSRKDHRDANRIEPYLINELDQRILREAFRQAQSLQDRLRMDYQR